MFDVGCWLLDVRPFSQMERILIIEDETPMRTALADVLQGEGYRALTAPDGESGLRKAVDEKPDLILLDIMMPKLDGYAVCAELRRSGKQGRAPAKLKLGDVEIDLARQTAARERKPIHLTAKEFSMLRLMAEAAGEPVSREKFLDVVWGYTSFPTTRTVDNHIASLRAKLEKNPDAPRWIKTVHGVGYKLEL